MFIRPDAGRIWALAPGDMTTRTQQQQRICVREYKLCQRSLPKTAVSRSRSARPARRPSAPPLASGTIGSFHLFAAELGLGPLDGLSAVSTPHHGTIAQQLLPLALTAGKDDSKHVQVRLHA